MGRSVRYLGLAILAATAWVWIAQAGGWISDSVADAWTPLGLKASAALLLGGLILGLLNPVRRGFTRGRCARCGKGIERGQTYCLDHLQAAINEYRDRAHDGTSTRGRARV